MAAAELWWIAPAVALYITAAYWFTSSTSFANPAITLARSLSDSFAGIAPVDAPAFVVSQLAGAGAGWLLGRWLFSAGAAAGDAAATGGSRGPSAPSPPSTKFTNL